MWEDLEGLIKICSRKVPAENFCQTLAVNIDNENLSDAAFRDFVRTTLPIVDFPSTEEKET